MPPYNSVRPVPRFRHGLPVCFVTSARCRSCKATVAGSRHYTVSDPRGSPGLCCDGCSLLRKCGDALWLAAEPTPHESAATSCRCQASGHLQQVVGAVEDGAGGRDADEGGQHPRIQRPKALHTSRLDNTVRSHPTSCSQCHLHHATLLLLSLRKRRDEGDRLDLAPQCVQCCA
jgi:hypothetical protein